MIKYHTKPGMMLLTTVLLMGAVSLMVAVSIANRGIGEMSISYSDNQGIRAQNMAEGCTQNALLRLSRNSSYSGETLTVQDGVCVIAVETNGSNATIRTQATVGTWVRYITAQITVLGRSITIDSWKQSQS